MDLKKLALTPPDGPDPILAELSLALIYRIQPMDPLKPLFPHGTIEVEFAGKNLSVMSDRRLYTTPSEHQLAIIGVARRVPGVKSGQYLLSVQERIYRRLSYTDLGQERSSGLKKVQNGHIVWYVISDPKLNEPDVLGMVQRFIGTHFKELGRNLRKA